MNILEIKENADKSVDDRAAHIISIAMSMEEDVGSDVIPYISRVNGVEYDMKAYEETDYDNSYVDLKGCTRYVVYKKVSVSIEELPDTYEDYGTGSWSVSLPQDLVLFGDDDELRTFFHEMFRKDLEIKKIHKNHLYYNLWELDKDIILGILNHKDFGESKDDAIKQGVLLKECGVKLSVGDLK